MEEQTEQKKSKAWLWILIVLILLVLGVGIWFWLFGGSSSGLPAGLGGSSIPQPPALPN